MGYSSGTPSTNSNIGDDDKAKQILQRRDSLKSDRGNFESQWQDCKEYVRPNVTDFNRVAYPGDKRTLKIFDSTAGRCNRELGSGLHSYAMSPTDRWFNLTISNKPMLVKKPEVRMWLETISDIIYRHYAKPSAGHKTSLHEVCLDLGAFGTSILYQEVDMENKSLSFQCFPLASCLISVNQKGIVDTVYRDVEFTKRQCIQEFGAENLPRQVNEETNIDKVYKFCHAVYPRSDRDPSKLDKKNKKFASCWVSKEFKKIVRESGFNSFPYHCPRWSTVAGELYGRAPAMDCMPDILMINEMKKTILKGAQKRVSPVLVLDNDGFMLPISTAPDSIIYRDSSEGKIEVLQTGGDVELGIEILQQPRQDIGECFFVDWMKLEKENVQMTATEVISRRDEKLRLMSPMLGRLESELLSPMLQRSYELLAFLGELPDAPIEMQGQTLVIEYVSPAARAQMGTKATVITSTLRELSEIAAVAPNIYDRYNFDKVADILNDLRGITPEILRTDEELAAMRKNREDQQSMAAGADVGTKVSGAVKNLAQAQELSRR